MRNLKSKFIKELEVDISDAQQRIKELIIRQQSIPKEIESIEQHIGNLKTLKRTVENSDVPFEIYETEYKDDEEYF